MEDRDPITTPAGSTDSGPSETTPAVTESAGATEGSSQAKAPDTAKDATEPDSPEETFYDPKTAPPELQGEYKKMQAAFTRKMQALSKNREKVEAYEAFEKDPVATMQKMAAQYGMRLSPAQAQAALDKNASTGDDWTPNSWGEVIKRTKDEARTEILRELSPMLSEIHRMKQATIEQELSAIDPSWQSYEDAMVKNLKAHPSLAQDPALLYRVSVPAETIESRAVQKALKRFEDKGKATAAAGSSTTGKKPTAALREAKSVQEAWDIAREKLAEEGQHPPNRR